MIEKREVKMKEKVDLKKCIVKTTGFYYKWILIIGGIAAIVIGTIYGLVFVFETFGPSVVSTITLIPPWVCVPVGIVVIPFIVASVVCYFKKRKEEIKEMDGDYICQE